jgi:hypothetical protein
MSAASYAGYGNIQFSYSSADAFSYGQGAQRSRESALFDSYDLGGRSQGLSAAKAQAHLSSGTVTSGVSGGGVTSGGGDKGKRASSVGFLGKPSRTLFNNQLDATKTLMNESLSVYNAKKIHPVAGLENYDEVSVAGYVIEIQKINIFGEDTQNFQYTSIRAELAGSYGELPNGTGLDTATALKSKGLFSNQSLYSKVIVSSRSSQEVSNLHGYYKELGYLRARHHKNEKAVPIYVLSDGGRGAIFKFQKGWKTQQWNSINEVN